MKQSFHLSMEDEMEKFNFIALPKQVSVSPIVARRQNLIQRLEEQAKLSTDPYFTRTVRAWVTDETTGQKVKREQHGVGFRQWGRSGQWSIRGQRESNSDRNG
jgi:hypothetical protein